MAALLDLIQNGSTLTLIVFFIILLIYLWYSFSIIYHLIRFGIGTHPKTIALVFFVGSLVLFALAVSAYLRIDWSGYTKPPFEDPFS